MLDVAMGSPRDETARSTGRKGPLRLLARTLSKAWEGSIFSEAAEAAFWQVLSFPPLLLGLLGSLGYLGDWFGPEVVSAVKDRIISTCRTIFSQDVVNGVIVPTVDQILTTGKGEIVSVGFLISLWAGSSAMSSFVDAITAAHDQYGVRNEVWQRIFALLLYMASLVLLIIGLPVVALGPDLLPQVFPDSWQPTIESWLSGFYYPGMAVLLVVALATLYKLSLPNKLPWHRLVPGAVLAMAVFLLSSIGLRLYIQWITTTGYTYGALATPIAFLLFAYLIGLAITLGAYFNSALQEMWPARMTRRQRRRWQRLELERAAERIRSDEVRQPPQAGPPADTAPDRDHTAPSPADTNHTVPLPVERRGPRETPVSGHGSGPGGSTPGPS
ncbi:YihY/virulence factor BrkB family protein [Saccharothrix sp. 6-C]|uniref:YihY/virulence factor BrkB family protein n=1 Tax=Saccharothrix sp. 6-C TaxID=2781735 RepID=UPI0019170DBF|nr:YihY/virulence factor BrkB family protein [Saccharothrix sp. 6-C]QQQ77989.1 YihY/virulence factor BrkB family protein [Saccharothrix sp. 6-C]